MANLANDASFSFFSFPGNFGNTIDGQSLGEPGEEVRRDGENPFIHSLTPPVRPVTNDRQYYHIPWEDSKPCTHVKFSWQDHRRRLYNSNVLLKICERLVCLAAYVLCTKPRGVGQGVEVRVGVSQDLSL